MPHAAPVLMFSSFTDAPTDANAKSLAVRQKGYAIKSSPGWPEREMSFGPNFLPQRAGRLVK